MRSWDPGLTVDRSGGRAFVVQAEAPVVEVDLTTFGVQSHPLEPPARTADAVPVPLVRPSGWVGGRWQSPGLTLADPGKPGLPG
jgi:hypothetical protein